MSTRTQRVEAMLQREIADVLFRGSGLRDPRLQNTAAISITGVQVSPDLGTARVFVDTLSPDAKVDGIVEALNAAARWMRGQIGQRVQLKRVPTLRFERDSAIGQGAAIERVLLEIAHEQRGNASPAEDAVSGAEDEPEDDES